MILIEGLDFDLAALLAGHAPSALKVPEGGIERPEVLQMLRDLANSIRPGFSPACWMMIQGEEIVGLCSLVRPPDDLGIDIGYGVAATRRNRGFATAAVSALLEWARGDDRVSTVRAETSIHNLPSQHVLQRNGFHHIGMRVDEDDGELMCWSVSVGR